MNEKQILQKLNLIFRDVFDDDSIVVDRSTTADDIEDWDSLEHITLVAAVEKAFRVRFKMNEVSTMKNVGEMVDIIASRCGK